MGGECWLKKERSLTKKKEEKSLVSGTRKACPPCKGKYELDTAYPDPGRELNNGKEDKTGSPEACQALCKTNPQCQLWTWGRNGGECWLKKERSLTKRREVSSIRNKKGVPIQRMMRMMRTHYSPYFYVF